MRFLLSLLLFLSPLSALSETLEANVGNGNLVRIHSDQGICLFPAKRAEWQGKNIPAILGCWRMNGDLVYLVFFDGDIARIPITLFQPPKTL
jgi:hypothetical protein